MTSFKTSTILVGLSLIGAVAIHGQPSFQAVKMTNDGSPIQIGNTSYYPIRINNSLQVVLSSTNFSTLEVYTNIWQEQMLVPPGLPGIPGFREFGAHDINNLGQLAGRYLQPIEGQSLGDHEHAYYTQDNSIQILPTFPNAHRQVVPVGTVCLIAQGWGINEAGHISGFCGRTNGDVDESRAVIWRDGQIFEQGTFPGHHVDSVAYNLRVFINDADQIAGTVTLMSIGYFGQNRAYFGSGGALTEIPPFGSGIFSWAGDINNNGQVVGWAHGAPGTNARHAFIWDNGAMTDIHGELHTDSTIQSQALGLNDSAWVVGVHTGLAGNSLNGFLYRPGEGTYDINDLIVNDHWSDGGSRETITTAWDINDYGFIVATYTTSGSVARPCLLVPVESGIIVNSEGDLPDLDPDDGRPYTGGKTIIQEDECTLRAAIEFANDNPGVDTIRFRIPVAGIPSIAVGGSLGALPAVTEPVFIAGNTQPQVGKVAIEGSAQATGHGLIIEAGPSEIRGMIIHSFPGIGLVLSGADSCTIENLIIGTDESGQTPLGNSGAGLYISGSYNEIGSALYEDSNVIAFNYTSGVHVQSGRGNTIRRNRIYANGGLGIDIAPAGVNDNDTLDADAGPNESANYPVIDSVVGVGADQTAYCTIWGEPNDGYIVEFFANDECDSVYLHGEGLISLGTDLKITDNDGIASFTYPVGASLQPGQFLTMTATIDGSTSEFSKCWPLKILELVDGQGYAISLQTFPLYRVANDPPTFTEEYLFDIKTNIQGQVDIAPYLLDGTLAVGDSIRIGRVLDHGPPRDFGDGVTLSKHTISLDNAKFDSLDYHMYYDRLDNTDMQEIRLDHTTVGLNISIATEWEAGDQYMDDLITAVRRMADLLYDVGDGQIRLDTVVLFNRPDRSLEPIDICLLASNTHRPESREKWYTAFGQFRSDGNWVSPRWFGQFSDAPSSNIAEEPLMPYARHHVHAMTMLAAVSGYSSLYFRPEGLLRFGPGGSCSEQYGLLDVDVDSYFESPPATEMSNTTHYEDPACRRTEQYKYWQASAWDYFESVFELTFEGVHAEIIKPDERYLPPGRRHFEGPNDGAFEPDYDAGARVEIVDRRTPRAGRDFILEVTTPDSAQSAIGVSATLVRSRNLPYPVPFNRHEIALGKAAANGQIRVLGAEPGDYLNLGTGGRLPVPGGSRRTLRVASDTSLYRWLYGEYGIPDTTADTLTATLEEVQGVYPVTCVATSGGTMTTIRLYTLNAFPDDPSCDLAIDSTVLEGLALSPALSGYEVDVADSLAGPRAVRVNAIDDLANNFSFDFDYMVSYVSDSGPSAGSVDGDFMVIFGDTSGPNETVTITSCNYPPMRGDLPDYSVRAGRVHSFMLSGSADPVNPVTVGLEYDQSDLAGVGGQFSDEEYLRLYRYDTVVSHWDYVGGMVDTAQNRVWSEVTEAGIYALFTTDVTTDVGDDPTISLPTSFSLEQNYPNPFNPVTTIAYSLPQRGRVTLDVFNILGRKVASLVDREQPAGTYRVTWDGTDDAGVSVATGVYLYRFRAGDVVHTRKMLLLK